MDPPTWSDLSSTVTSWPHSFSFQARDSAVIPEPIITIFFIYCIADANAIRCLVGVYYIVKDADVMKFRKNGLAIKTSIIFIYSSKLQLRLSPCCYLKLIK